MICVGIDVSKGKSTVAAMRPFGEVVLAPFDVNHRAGELDELLGRLRAIDGEVRIVMEYTGRYYQPIAHYLFEAGYFVSVVHPKLIHDFGNNSIRGIKTDKADAVKIANYGLSNWLLLRRYTPADETRALLKNCNRQYNQYMKLKNALRNNLMAILDETFPGVNKLFTSPVRSDGHEKWVDFAEKYWHCELISSMSKRRFTTQFNLWSTKHGYHRSDEKAAQIHDMACDLVATLPPTQGTKELIVQAIAQLNNISFAIMSVKKQMQELARTLPEYPAVLAMRGVGETIGPQLMAEIGDVRRFPHKGSLVAFAGVDAPPYQSGGFTASHRSISKRGSPCLRKTLFVVMQVLLEHSPEGDPVYQFLDRKRSEGKRYYVYMVAGCNKFLRIYYARISEYLNTLEVET